MSTVREATYDVLRSSGMTTVFGNPGSTELPFLMDFPNDLDYVLGLHEGVVVAMADGYAQGKGNAAFINLHTVTGLGNAMGAIVTAYHNRTPLVVTAGQQDRRHLALKPRLSGSMVELAQPYVKWAYEPSRAEDVPFAIARAYATAMQEPRGPVFVSIPMNDWEAQAPPFAHREVSNATAPDPRQLKKVAEMLCSSERPALVVGFGVDRAGAWDGVVELAERLNAEVWSDPTTVRASFPQDHRLFRGVLPPAQAPIAAKLSRYDTVLVLGAPVFEYYPYVPGPVVEPGTRLALITDDPEDAARTTAGFAVSGNLALAVRELLERVPRLYRAVSEKRPEPAAPEATAPMTVDYLLYTLGRLLPPEAIITEESPSSKKQIYEYLRAKRPGSYYTTGSGGLGFALPAAVGLKMARPQRPVVCLIGDGASMYSIQALWNAAQYDAPVLVVVVDNGQYTILKSFGDMLGARGSIPGLDLPGLDLVRAAETFGCKGERVERAEELPEALEWALRTGHPTLLDVLVSKQVPELLE
jgi:benzoylformate decarboxylase